ncbi:MAG: DNA replication/repair protein RecF [candidate division KSB1 bacterium]|nr:DNA replication/repair protein RecF [candidate division KSB1 bacterium]MDZ7335268.1 DNA replication/repair protein RecF [candidate division KSB1 bacterium]MDZ7399805.1 DNA replication/repair protein RecF [candidate division KSB1 bacterium]
MILQHLELTNFRNYEHIDIVFGSHKNFLIGRNAQGKTNILEAIYKLCLSKSFRTNFDKEEIRFTQDHYILKGRFESDGGNSNEVGIYYSLQRGKEIIINHKAKSKASDLIGNFPVVLSSPDENAITSGPPIYRRKFIDILLCQLNKNYLFNLLNYNRILQQRNKLLLDCKISKEFRPSIIEPWNQNLIETGSRIIAYRYHFCSQFSNRLNQIYSELSGPEEELTFEYCPNFLIAPKKEIESIFKQKLMEVRNHEISRGVSIVGPHLDNFEIKINGKEIRKYGSRGQHKTVAISLALAQFEILKEQLSETPIMLLDDLYSEIDEIRRAKILDILSRVKQVFITATLLPESSKICDNDRVFIIADGNVKLISN